MNLSRKTGVFCYGEFEKNKCLVIIDINYQLH